MNSDFVAKVLRAVGSLRSGDPAGVSNIVQSALDLASSASANTQGSANAHFRLPELPWRPGAMPFEGMRAPDWPESAAGEIHHPNGLRSGRLRKSLGEVVRTLAAGHKGLRLEGMMPGLSMPASAPDLPVPEGAKFRDLRYSCAAGARRYRLYVPASAGDGLQGLVLMLHGCTQNPEVFAAGTGMNALAEEHRLLIAYPAQTAGDNSMSCWHWFRPGDQMRDAGEPAILAGLTESVRSEFAISLDRVFVAGLSAGGGMAAIMAETYPELYAAVGIHSGFAYGSANDVVSAFSTMRGQDTFMQPRRANGGANAVPRAIIFHGSADNIVHPSNAARIIASQGGDPARMARFEHAPTPEFWGYTRMVAEREDGMRALECWIVDGAQHAWFGGHPDVPHTDPRGPNASAEMVRFFLGAASNAPGM